jgi:hypothetical protein
MMFGDTFALYCEKHTEQIHTQCGQNVESLPHRKHIYVSTTKANRLMLFGESFAV